MKEFNLLLMPVNVFRHKRQCNVEHGSLNCWRATTDGFTYGLSTAMVDYCQALLQLRQTADDK
ncbi:unnamed protein product, partial [Rotaria magnacalcarata]